MAVLKTRLLIAFLMLLSVSQIFSQNIVISGNNGELEYMDGLPVLKAEVIVVSTRMLLMLLGV